MPQAVGLLVGYIGAAVGYGTGSATLGAIAAGVAKVAIYSGITAVAGRALAPNQPKPDIGRTVTTRSTTEPQKLIYGQTRVSGPVTFIGTEGIENRDLWKVITLAGHELNSMTDVWIGNERIPNANIGSGAAAGGAVDGSNLFSPATWPDTEGVTFLHIYKYYGTSTQTADSSLTSGFTGWTTNHRGRGYAYIAMQQMLNIKNEPAWRGHNNPNVSVLVQGKKDIYDPRLDVSPGASPNNPSYQAYTTNPALCTADYLSTRCKFGPQYPDARIDWDAVVTAADACEVSVSTPSGSQFRFTCNGVLYGNRPHKQNLGELLGCMNGALTYSGGKFVIRAGIYEAPTVTLTEDDFAGDGLEIVTSRSKGERVNQIKGVYIEPNDQYKLVEFPLVDPGTYVTRDNGKEFPQSISLNLTNNSYEAQRIAWKRLRKYNQMQLVRGRFSWAALQLAVGDRVNISVPEMNWAPNIYEVIELTIADDVNDDYAVELLLREDSSSAYNDPASPGDYSTYTAGGVLELADPAPPVPSNLAVAAVNSGNQLTWTNPSDDTNWSHIQIWASATSAWSGAVLVGTTRGNTYLHTLPSGTVRYYWVRTIDANGRASDRDPDSDTSTITATSGITDATSNENPQTNYNITNEIWQSEDFGDNDITRWNAYRDGQELPGSNAGEKTIVAASGTLGGYALRVGNNSGNDEGWFGLCNQRNAIPVAAGDLFRMTTVCRQLTPSPNTDVYLYIGFMGYKGDVRNGNGTVVAHDGTANAAIAQHWFNRNGVFQSSTWTTTHTYFTKDTSTTAADYNTGSIHDPHIMHKDIEYIVPYVVCNYNDKAGQFELSYINIEKVAGNTFGAIATLDEVGQLDLANYSVARVSFASNTADQALTASSWTEIETVTVVAPSNVADSAILVEVNFTLFSDPSTGSTGTNQLIESISHRLQDHTDDTVFNDAVTYQMIRSITNAAGYRRVACQIALNYLVQPANIDASTSNVFKCDLFTSLSDMEVRDVMMRATLLNRSD